MKHDKPCKNPKPSGPEIFQHGWGGGLNSHDFFERIISLENLFLAWKEFRRGKARKRDIQEFEFNLEDNLFQLHCELRNKTYRHSPYTAFYITDPKLRHIHKACIWDRVVHHAIFRILYPIFDPTFIHDSYSCRMGKGTHRAVKRLKKFTDKLGRNNRQNVFVLKCDVKKFFDSVDHGSLLNLIKQKLSDTDAVWLLETIVGSFKRESGKGLPIGNVTSQIFANIYLNELDKFVKHELRAKYYIRYCDDFVVLDLGHESLERICIMIEDFLRRDLKLELHPNKITIIKFSQGIDFLGYVVRPHCITLRTKTRNRLLQWVNRTNLSSYLGLLKHCNGYKLEGKVSEIMLKSKYG